MAEITRKDYETLAAFRYALRRFLRFSEERAMAVGLMPQQHQALLAVKGFPDRDCITIGELAERLQVKHHSAVGLVDRLVVLDLLQRVPSQEDRRQVYLAITARGDGLLHQLSQAHKEELQRMGPELVHLLNSLREGQVDP